ncbi:hypothetical protein [uncultured Clostridium sp.]|uniref:hypothetical protein n=1 Tax=uncultured Clostridium sp. TaxID=59620 RepID=UPI0028EF80ED|nr:hypothetical protein [uncultured Clostridium sp.]
MQVKRYKLAKCCSNILKIRRSTSFNQMIEVGRNFKNVLNLSDIDVYDLLTR